MGLGMGSRLASNPSVIAFVRAFSYSRSLEVVTGNWVERCRNEEVPLGRADPGLPGQIHGMDTR
jgi:hypothetical protein